MALGIRASDAGISAAPLGAGARGPGDSLATRLAWITGLRLALLVLLLVATAALYLRGELDRYPYSLRITFTAVAAGFAPAALSAALPRAGRRPPPLAWGQISLDPITWTATLP